jgi:MFS family permease
MGSISYAALLSLFASVLVILSAGFPLTFSLYAFSFQNTLGFSQVEVNSINVANIVGQFLCYPLVGALSDKYGANRVCLLSGILGVPALLLAANAYEHRQGYLMLAASFFMIGVASTCGYITSVSTCARNFAGARGLAIAIPVCAYGFATLLYTIVFDRYFTKSDQSHEQHDISAFWRALCWFIGCAALLGFVFMTDQSKSKDQDQEDGTDTESTQLLPTADVESMQPPFFQDVTVLLYAVAYILAAGSTETLVGNMGSIVDSILRSSNLTPANSSAYASRAVSIFAIFSTLSRLIVGVVGDALAKRGRSRVIILLALSICMSGAIFLLALSPPSTTLFYLVVGINGFCYGSLYCIGPTLASVIWGLRDFGRNWGILAYSPLVGSVLGSYLYATLYDHHAKLQHSGHKLGNLLCAGRGCYAASFMVMGAAVLLATFIWAAAWRIWRLRHIIV